MVTKVDIVSDAFTNLGRNPVSDIDSSSEPIVITASKKYDLLLLNELGNHPWRFATLTRDLNLLAAEPPVKEFSNAFQLPTDFLKMERVNEGDFFRIYENKLYTNTQSIQIDYTAKVDESRFPAYFSLYMGYRLTQDMAMPLTQQLTIKKDWTASASRQLLLARFQDSQQQPSDVIVNDPITAAHIGSVRGSGR